MPFTPFHEGPAILIGLLLLGILDFPTLLIASVIIDIEPFLVIVLNLNYPLHGYLHTFVGATLMAIITTILMIPLRPYLTPILESFKVTQEVSNLKILMAAFIGTYSHILLDAPLYPEMNPFYPYIGNPFYGLFSATEVYMFCIITFIIGLLVYISLIITSLKGN